MSSELTSEALIEFICAHPEYFDGEPDFQMIARRIRSDVEAYSRALDPAEYEALQHKVAKFRAKEALRLQAELSKLCEQLEREREKFDAIVLEIVESEARIKKMELEYQDALNIVRPSESPTHSSSAAGGYFYIVLDCLGMVFLYIGFVLTETPLLSYVFLGIICIVWGIVLQQKKTMERVDADSGVVQILHDMQARNARSTAAWRIKKHTLTYRKRLALKTINDCDDEIRGKLKSLNGSNT
jgi:hypothetical protein